eukprot:Pgem_evm1s18315
MFSKLSFILAFVTTVVVADRYPATKNPGFDWNHDLCARLKREGNTGCSVAVEDLGNVELHERCWKSGHSQSIDPNSCYTCCTNVQEALTDQIVIAQEAPIVYENKVYSSKYRCKATDSRAIIEEFDVYWCQRNCIYQIANTYPAHGYLTGTPNHHPACSLSGPASIHQTCECEFDSCALDPKDNSHDCIREHAQLSEAAFRDRCENEGGNDPLRNRCSY